LLDSGLWLLLGFALAGVVHALIPRSFITRQLAGRGPWPVLKASLLGIPLPLCSCSVIPVAAGLRRAGAGKGPSAAFAISTPQTGEESIPLTWALFGPVFAIARPVAAVVSAFIAGVLIDVVDRHQTRRERADLALPIVPTLIISPGTTPSATTQEQRSIINRLRRAWRHGAVTMPTDLAPWLAIGLVLAAMISAAVPPNWFAENVGSGLVPMLLMLIVGVPLYICATSSTPLAATLVAAGLSPGAALVLLLAGPATNVATMAWVLKDLGVRALAIYLGVISAVAVGFGLAFDAFWRGAVVLGGAHDHGGDSVMHRAMVLGAIGLIALVAFGLGRRARRVRPAQRTEGRSCCA
jgi:hypothetical protein